MRGLFVFSILRLFFFPILFVGLGWNGYDNHSLLAVYIYYRCLHLVLVAWHVYLAIVLLLYYAFRGLHLKVCV